jgi:hypothetical protein
MKNLLKLFILIGMNDMAHCFLHVFSYNEHEAYFCFAYYITQSGEHFTEKGIAFKIKQLPKLVEIVDQLLYDRIVSLNVELWTFCHRMLFIYFLLDDHIFMNRLVIFMFSS